jgi:UDP-glucuronate 4-epimerase
MINLGGHASATVLELIQAIERATGCTAVLDFVPQPLGDVNQTYADIAKAKRLLGFAPKVRLEEAARRFVAWYRSTMEVTV